MAFAFEKLLVYQKAVAFADAVCSLTRGFPRGCFFLADQLRAPNRMELAGPCTGQTAAYWHQSGHCFRRSKANLEEIARMLSGLINGLDSRGR